MISGYLTNAYVLLIYFENRSASRLPNYNVQSSFSEGLHVHTRYTFTMRYCCLICVCNNKITKHVHVSSRFVFPVIFLPRKVYLFTCVRPQPLKCY